MCRVIFLITILCIVSADKLPDNLKFRSDYTYNPKTDAYYKVHVDQNQWSLAKSLCKVEGSRLMITTFENRVFAHSLYKRLIDIEDKFWVETKDEFEEEEAHRNDEEYNQAQSTPDQCPAMNRDGEVEKIADCTLNFPYICSIDKKDIYYDSRCDVLGKGYIRNNVTNSCYKMSMTAMNWYEGEQECRNENSHLLVINSKTEQEEINKFMKTYPTHTPGSFHSYYVNIGFRIFKNEKDTRIFRTIFNDTLDVAGYNVWSPGEPNNVLGSEYCGSLYRNDGLLNDVNCAKPYAFICEKELKNI